MDEHVQSPAVSRGNWKWLGLLGLLTLTVFWRGIHAEFLTWDDEPLIYANPNIATPTPDSLAWHWKHPHFFLYIPVIYTVWWSIARLQWAISGPSVEPNPVMFHLANLLVHLASTAVVYWIIRRVVGRSGPALVGAVIFAVHPLQVEAVAWATGMKDVLGGFLTLAAVALYLAAVGNKPWRWALATLIFLLALLAKPSAIVAPAIAFVLDWLVMERSPRSAFVRLWPWMIMAVVWAVVTKRVQPAPEIDAGPWWLRPWIAADAVGFYLWKLAWPLNLAMDYGRTPRWVLAGPAIWNGATAIFTAIGIGALRSPKISAAGLVFLAALAPVLGFAAFVFQSQSTVADRYVYVAMLGPAIGLALAASAVPQKTAVIGSLFLVAGWSILSYRQVDVWHDNVALYRHALAVNPQSLTATQDLAVVYDKAGDELQATNYYVRAIEIAPDTREEYDNLAMALPRAQQELPAMADRWANLHELLAKYYQEHGESQAAMEHAQAARRLR